MRLVEAHENVSGVVVFCFCFNYLKKKKNFFFLAGLGLGCSVQAFSSCVELGLNL